MSDSDDCCCCRCCLRFIITAGLAALFMWLSLRPSKPKCSIQEFSVPALNKTSNFNGNQTIHFTIRLDNPNKEKGIYYDDVKIAFYYGPNNNTTLQIGNHTVPAFRQGSSKHADWEGTLETKNVPWKTASEAVRHGTPVVFSMDLNTTVRYKIVVWKTKRHGLNMKANVKVDDSGSKVSGASHIHYRALLGALVVGFFTLLILAL